MNYCDRAQQMSDQQDKRYAAEIPEQKVTRLQQRRDQQQLQH